MINGGSVDKANSFYTIWGCSYGELHYHNRQLFRDYIKYG